jgi:rRNA-processing protein FCF1
MILFQSFHRRLTDELQEIETAIIDLWRTSQIEEFRNDPDSAVVLITHRYYWKTLEPEHRGQQAQLIGKYRHWHELFERGHSRHSSEVQQEIKETNDYIIAAIELQTGWSTKPTVEQNGVYLSKKLGGFRQLLAPHGTPQYVLVPDTNALLKTADPAKYSPLIDCAAFRFVITPTVLAELDNLKRNRAGQTLGEKAERAIRFIKGFRKQGSVLDGVTVAKTITVQMIASEPRMNDLPNWLDSENQDDRIIGSLLEIQCAQPSTVVVLVTDDVNLQNKAEMAFLPWAEPPEI